MFKARIFEMCVVAWGNYFCLTIVSLYILCLKVVFFCSFFHNLPEPRWSLITFGFGVVLNSIGWNIFGHSTAMQPTTVTWNEKKGDLWRVLRRKINFESLFLTRGQGKTKIKSWNSSLSLKKHKFVL